MSDDEDEMEATEEDGELQIVTECWIEPQNGVCINNTLERKQFEGLTCYEMANTVSLKDRNTLNKLFCVLCSYYYIFYLKK